MDKYMFFWKLATCSEVFLKILLDNIGVIGRYGQEISLRQVRVRVCVLERYICAIMITGYGWWWKGVGTGKIQQKDHYIEGSISTLRHFTEDNPVCPYVPLSRPLTNCLSGCTCVLADVIMVCAVSVNLLHLPRELKGHEYYIQIS